MSTGTSASCSNKPIKLESGSELLCSHGDDNFRERQYGGFNRWRGRNFNSCGSGSSYSKNWRERSEHLKHGVTQKGPKQQSERTVNPRGPNGIFLWCKICDSILHLFKDCPHRYDCPEQAKVFQSENTDDVVLFTCSKSDDMCLLTIEARNSVVPDSGCTSTVARTNWINCFLDSLSVDELSTVRMEPGVKNFRFGGVTTKKSWEIDQFPCRLADRNIFICTDIVDSDVPLLLSKNSMKEAKIKLDLENDKVEIFGKLLDLDCTSSEHYCVPLHSTPVNVEECMLAEKIEDISDKQKILNKIHKQFDILVRES